jgi:predicted RecA/RadA family phage recombinase
MPDISRTKRESEHVIELACPSAGLTEGQMRLVGATIGVVQEDYVLGDVAILVTESELIKLPKSGSAGVAFTVGEQVYFDSGTGLVKKTAGGYYRCGSVKIAAAATDTTVICAFDGEHYVIV